MKLLHIDSSILGQHSASRELGAAIVARWTFGDGQLVDETSQSIVSTGPATTTFHIAKPDGWPVGKYDVAITIDGTPATTKAFAVE